LRESELASGMKMRGARYEKDLDHPVHGVREILEVR
jgi:hypothetical protein